MTARVWVTGLIVCIGCFVARGTLAHPGKGQGALVGTTDQGPLFFSQKARLDRIPYSVSQTFESFFIHGYSAWAAFAKLDFFVRLRDSLVANSLDPDQRRLSAIFETLRPHIEDPKYRECSQALLYQAEFSVAFSTGCRVFISRDYLHGFNDEDIAFILAHELAHSIRGDTVRYWLHRIKDFAIYVPRKIKSYVTQDEVVLFQELHQSELDADIEAARMFQKMGFPAGAATAALKNTNFISDNSPPQALDERHGWHPSPRERLRAVLLHDRPHHNP